MTDILERLRKELSIATNDLEDVLCDAITEIETLRSQVADFEADAMGKGAERALKSFREIKQDIKDGVRP